MRYSIATMIALGCNASLADESAMASRCFVMADSRIQVDGFEAHPFCNLAYQGPPTDWAL